MKNNNDTLFIIPARGGSKGLPRKNILALAGKPLIAWTIDAAREVTNDENICVSTDDEEIKQWVESYGLKVPFIRPAELATDTAGSREVILQALDFYHEKLGKSYSKVCLLQPTSPLRTGQHINEAMELFTRETDMVVSVKESKANPYFNLFEEDEAGHLQQSKEGHYTRRQDAPKVWEYNGAIYIISSRSVRLYELNRLPVKVKYIMSEEDSVDIDTLFDLQRAEHILLSRNKTT